RIGRTGRAGRHGISITLATPSDGKYIDAITRLVQREIPLVPLPGGPDDADEAPREERTEKRGRRRQARGGRAPEPAGSEPARSEATRSEAANAEHAPRRGEPRPAREPVSDKPAARPRRPHREDAADREPAGFGPDSPIPAFLLRP